MKTHDLVKEIRAIGDVSVLRLGRLILSTPVAEAVCAELYRLVSESGRRKLRLDFSGVEYLSGTALSMLLDLHAHLRAGGGGLFFDNAEAGLALTRLSGVRDAYQFGVASSA